MQVERNTQKVTVEKFDTGVKGVDSPSFSHFRLLLVWQMPLHAAQDGTPGSCRGSLALMSLSDEVGKSSRGIHFLGIFREMCIPFSHSICQGPAPQHSLQAYRPGFLSSNLAWDCVVPHLHLCLTPHSSASCMENPEPGGKWLTHWWQQSVSASEAAHLVLYEHWSHLIY